MNHEVIEAALIEAGFKSVEFRKEDVASVRPRTDILVEPIIANKSGEFVVLQVLRDNGCEYDDHRLFNSQSVVVNVRQRPDEDVADRDATPIVPDPSVELDEAMESV